MANTKRKASLGASEAKRRAKEWYEEQEEAKRAASGTAHGSGTGAAAATPGKLSAAEQKRRAKEWFEQQQAKAKMEAASSGSSKRKADAATPSRTKTARPSSAEAQREKARQWARAQGIRTDDTESDEEVEEEQQQQQRQQRPASARKRPSTPKRKYSEDSRQSVSSQHVISDDEEQKSVTGSDVEDDGAGQAMYSPAPQPVAPQRKSILNQRPARVPVDAIVDSPPAVTYRKEPNYNFGVSATQFVRDGSYHSSYSVEPESQGIRRRRPSSGTSTTRQRDPPPATPVKYEDDEEGEQAKPATQATTTTAAGRPSFMGAPHKSRVMLVIGGAVLALIVAYFAWQAALQYSPNFHLNSIIRERCCGMQACTASDTEFEVPVGLFDQIQAADATAYDAYPVSQTSVRVTTSRLRSVQESLLCSAMRVSRYLFWGLVALAVVAVIVYRWKTSTKRSELMLEQSYDIAQAVKSYLQAQDDVVPIEYCKAHVLDQAADSYERKYIEARWPYVCKIIAADPRIREFVADLTTGTHRVWQYIKKPSFADPAGVGVGVEAKVLSGQSLL